MENWESKPPVQGTCPDMCPEKERGIRETIEDLDPFERVDGNRNQTSKHLALKKYTRTPDMAPELIRPLTVCEASMEHMLRLLDQPYDSADLLGLHRFLWDRMRAIRMDLRMQHLFGRRSIVMYEQMIRFHIVVMHELCEHAIGQALDMGFDAHLNIEQLNRTFSDLFQMYDDHYHDKITVPTEAEFRGYYILLKMSSHPGFNVLPNELSQDIIKMRSHVFHSNEVQFAIEVARSFRFDDYVSFFRLAKKATFLKGCLMHAHFNKVRSKALFIINSSLNKLGGYKLADFMEVCSVEEDEARRLLEHHGAQISENHDGPKIMKSRLHNQENFLLPRKSELVKALRSSAILLNVIGGGPKNMFGYTTPASTSISLSKPTPFTSSSPSSTLDVHPSKILLQPSFRFPSQSTAPPVPPPAPPRLPIPSTFTPHPFNFPTTPSNLTPSVNWKNETSTPTLTQPFTTEKERKPDEGLMGIPPFILTPYPSPPLQPSLIPFSPAQSSDILSPSPSMISSIQRMRDKDTEVSSKVDGIRNLVDIGDDTMQNALEKDVEVDDSIVSSSTYDEKGKGILIEEGVKGRVDSSKGVVIGNKKKSEFKEWKVKIAMEAWQAAQEAEKKEKERREAELLILEKKKKAERSIESRKRQTLRYILRRWKRYALEAKKLRQDKEYALQNISLASHFYTSPFEFFPKYFLDDPSGLAKQLSFPYASMYLHAMFVKLRDERERNEKAMFAPLDIPSLVASTLHRKNKQLPSICWKITICSRLFDSSADLHKVPLDLRMKIGQWLRVKFSDPNEKGALEEMISNKNPNKKMNPRVSTVQNILFEGFPESDNSQIGVLPSKLWFIVRDVQFDESGLVDELGVVGSSAIIFILMDGIDLEAERQRLLTLVRAVPDSKSVPLLILAFKPQGPSNLAGNKMNDEASTSMLHKDHFSQNSWNSQNLKKAPIQSTVDTDEDEDAAIRRLSSSLGLSEPEFQKISGWRVCFMKSKKSMQDGSDCQAQENNLEKFLFSSARTNFLDDSPLIEGLRFLAEKSEKQPEILSISAVKLLQRHLDVHLLALKFPLQPTPDELIQRFNEMIRQICEKVQFCNSFVREGYFPNEINESFNGGELRTQAEKSFPVMQPEKLESVEILLSTLCLPSFTDSSCSACSDWLNYSEECLTFEGEDTLAPFHPFTSSPIMFHPTFDIFHSNAHKPPQTTVSLPSPRFLATLHSNSPFCSSSYIDIQDTKNLVSPMGDFKYTREEKADVEKQFNLFFHVVWHYLSKIRGTSSHDEVVKQESFQLAKHNCRIVRRKKKLILLPLWHSLMMPNFRARILSLLASPPVQINVSCHMYMDAYFGKDVERGGDLLPRKILMLDSSPSSLPLQRPISLDEFFNSGVELEMERLRSIPDTLYAFMVEQQSKRRKGEWMKKRPRFGKEEAQRPTDPLHITEISKSFPFEAERLEGMVYKNSMEPETSDTGESDLTEEKLIEETVSEEGTELEKSDEPKPASVLTMNPISAALERFDEKVRKVQSKLKKFAENLDNAAEQRNRRLGITFGQNPSEDWITIHATESGNVASSKAGIFEKKVIQNSYGTLLGDETDLVFLSALRKENKKWISR